MQINTLKRLTDGMEMPGLSMEPLRLFPNMYLQTGSCIRAEEALRSVCDNHGVITADET